jgi:hypothetical protein
MTPLPDHNLLCEQESKSFTAVWKDRIDIVQSLISIIAIIVGGWWTYDIFLKERRNLPHANLEHIVSHFPLTQDINLLSVVVKITNNGQARMDIASTDVRIQQVLPMLPCAESQIDCATDELDIALQETARAGDRFHWTKIAGRKNFLESPLLVEPGETEYMDFEFAIPADTRLIRVYSYIRNETDTKLGWDMSNFYEMFP